MDYQAFVETLSPEVVARLREGVATGRWPDGSELTPQQREHSLQAVIAWEERYLPKEERVGYIDKRRKAGATGGASQEQELRWMDKPQGENP